MTGQDLFLFLLTFITGLVIGMYVYVAAFKPTYAPEGLSSVEDAASDLSIVGKQYGGPEGPEYIRPSFRVLGDGTYAYIPGGTGDSALQPTSGELSRSLLRALRSGVTKESLVLYSEPAIKETCRAYSGGYDYEYRIVIENKQYTIDTCQTLLSYDDELALILDDVWAELSGEEVLPRKRYEGSISDMATEWLYDRLHSN